VYDVNQLVELPAWCSALGGEVFATNATSGGAYVMHSALLLSSQLNFKILGGMTCCGGPTAHCLPLAVILATTQLPGKLIDIYR
jgi:hypothetical protein